MIKDHEWIRKARIYAIEQWWPPFWPKIEVDWERVHQTMQRLHMNTLQVNALTKWIFFPAEFGIRHPDLGNRDIVREAQEFCEKYNYKWILYIPLCSLPGISALTERGTQSLYIPSFPVEHNLCEESYRELVPEHLRHAIVNSSFGDEWCVEECILSIAEGFLKMVKECADRYSYHAVWTDGPDTFTRYAYNPCTCEACREAYLKEFRVEMPQFSGMQDEAFLKMKHLSKKRVRSLFESFKSISTRGGELPLFSNLAQTGQIHEFPELLGCFDGALHEFAPDRIEFFLKSSEAQKYTSMPIMYPDSYDAWPRLVTSGWEAENKALSLLSAGVVPYLAQAGKYYYDDGRDEPVRKVFGLMEQNEELLARQEPMEYCALIHSGSYLSKNWSRSHRESLRGWAQAVLDIHMPSTAFPKFKLRDFPLASKFKVLILSDVRDLDGQELEVLREYVEQGGGLLLEYQTGLEHKKELGELFDLHARTLSKEDIVKRNYYYEGRAQYTYDVYLRSAQNDDGFPLPGPRIHPSEYGTLEPGSSWNTVSQAVTPYGCELFPILAHKTIGKGKVVFSSSPFGFQYNQRRDPDLAQWMNQLVSWLGGSMPVEVTASRQVHAAVTQSMGKLLIYLVNNSNDVQNTRTGWFEMMKVAEKPTAVGKAELRIKDASAVEVLYGPQPDTIVQECDSLYILYENLQEHIVLQVE